MAKGQKRSGREPKKPKKAKPAPAQVTLAAGKPVIKTKAERD
ncbi:hypothetical protein [Roseomonas acroporae]|nr:hypothetical protein [Roseomonas acroporae]